MEIEQFLEQLASASPTPGGGSASALAGALSASLVSMVAGLSVARGQIKKGEAEAIQGKALAIQKKLLKAVDEDARSFDGVMAAFRLPKATERQRLYRSKVIQRSYRNATVTPRVVCEESMKLLRFCNILSRKGNPNAWSDNGVAAFLANAALECGILNIRINLTSVKDRSFKKKMEGLVTRLEKERDRLTCLRQGSDSPLEVTRGKQSHNLI